MSSHRDISVERTFFLEPWQVTATAETLILREEASGRAYLLGGSCALGIALAVAAGDYGLWRRGTLGTTAANWLGLVALLLLAKGLEQFLKAWRVNRLGPRILTFSKDNRTVELRGFAGSPAGRVDGIVVSITTWHHEEPTTGQLRKPQTSFTVTLVVDGQQLVLGSYAARHAAERLADTISQFIGLPVSP